MEFSLLEIEIHKHSQSWISLFSIKCRYNLFHIEWNYERKIENIQILFIFDWYNRK